MKSRGLQAAADISAMLRARAALIWCATTEEARAEALIFEAAAAAAYTAHTWDVAAGARNLDGSTAIPDKESPDDMLETIRARATTATAAARDVWIMRDLPVWLTGPQSAPTQRRLRNLCRSLPGTPRERAQAIVVISPSSTIPAELASHATLVEFPLPDRGEIAAILDSTINNMPDGLRDAAKEENRREASIDAAMGLTGEEAAACYARSVVQFKRIDPAAVAGEKKRLIAREKVLEWIDPLPAGLDGVGGLENLKSWLMARRVAYTPEARRYGLPAPKGVLLMGIPGCGKSLTAKATATLLQSALIKFDFGALKSKYVGDSEANIRRAFRVIDAIGKCVVWIDEIEKGLAGATQGGADGGVSADSLGAFLTWAQDKTNDAFIIATSNDVSKLPPELLRKGRFDELFFVDLPTASERAAILAASLKAHGRQPTLADLNAVAAETPQFTGSELAELIPSAMFEAFADGGRELTTADLMRAAKGVTPLAVTAAEKIDGIRKMAQGRFRLASLPETQSAPKPYARELDI